MTNFCKLLQSFQPNGTAQPEGGEKPLDQDIAVRKMLKESPASIGQLLLPPALPVTLKDLSTKMYQEPRNPDLQGQERRLLEELESNQKAIEKKLSDSMGIDPGPCLHSTMLKGVTPHLDQQSRKKELTMEQKELLSQHQLNLMTRKRKSKWADPDAHIVIRTKGSIEFQRSNPGLPSRLVNESRVNPYRDKIEAGIVEEIPLVLPNLSQ